MPATKSYDESALILALAAGSESAATVARRLGLSPRYVQKIAAGQARSDLQPRIAAACQSLDDELRRQATPFARQLIERHIRLGLEGEGETARRCREFILTHLHLLSRHDRLDRQAAGRLDIAAARFHLYRDKVDPPPAPDPAADAPFKYYSFDDWMLHNYIVADPAAEDVEPLEDYTVVANCAWGRQPELLEADGDVPCEVHRQDDNVSAETDQKRSTDAKNAAGRRVYTEGQDDNVSAETEEKVSTDAGIAATRRVCCQPRTDPNAREFVSNMRKLVERRRPQPPAADAQPAQPALPPMPGGYTGEHSEPPPPPSVRTELDGYPCRTLVSNKTHFTEDDYRKRVIFQPPFGPTRNMPYVLARRLGLIPPDFE